ncbi:C2D1A protein, partial [Calcarius ornatus]|nr:C2D1A protein [Calcarius ornatus]
PQDPDPAGALLAELSERAELYRAALANTGTGNGARLRRLQRGLKTLEQLLASARRGQPIQRADIPPPVALGRPGGTPELPPEPPAPNPHPELPREPPAPNPRPEPPRDP